MSQTKLSTKGQVIIPRDIRERLNLKPGVLFDVVLSEDQIILRPIDPFNPLDYLYGRYKGEGLLDDLEAEHSAEIAKELE